VGQREHQDHDDAESDQRDEGDELLPPEQPSAVGGDEDDDGEGEEVDADADLEGRVDRQPPDPRRGERDERDRGRTERSRGDAHHREQFGAIGKLPMADLVPDDLGDEACHRDADDACQQGQERVDRGGVRIECEHRDDRQPGEGRIDALLDRPCPLIGAMEVTLVLE
jgi:hypothetical protein